LISYLTTAPDTHPVLARGDQPADPAQPHGWVTTPLPAAELFLHGAGTRTHVVWPAGATASAARVALPAGEWRLDGYRFGVDDDDSTRWTVAVTRVGMQAFTLPADATLAVVLRASLVLTFKAELIGQEIMLSGAVTGHDGAESTVFRGPRQVPTSYRLLDAAGATIAEGPLVYG